MRPNVYLLDEAGESTGFLVIGNDKACLIDTMMGYNDLKEADIILHGHAHDYDDISLMSAVLEGAKEILAGKNEKDTPYKYFAGEAKYHPFSAPEGKHFQQQDHGICYNTAD